VHLLSTAERRIASHSSLDDEVIVERRTSAKETKIVWRIAPWHLAFQLYRCRSLPKSKI
jgi:hypothetical protein